jgi:hypothetical protein
MLLLAQGPQGGRVDSDVSALRAGLDTLYGGEFARAAAYFETLAAQRPTDPAPVVFEAGAYLWWASALDSADFALQRIDSLLGSAMARARALPAGAGDFWLATALGYRARQREEHGHGFSAAKDAKAMRDIYRRLLAADSSCADCYLGLGVYDYGLARASALARFFARLIGLGSGNAERGIRYMRRAAHDGDLARVEGTWVLAAALMREAARDPAGRSVLQREARGYVETLAARYPGNPVFQRFLREVPVTSSSAREPIRPPAAAAPAAIAPPPVGRRQRRELAEHVVHVTLHRVGRDVEPLCNFFVAESGGDQVFDFLLALGESHDSTAPPEGRRVSPDAITRAARHDGRRRQIGSARDGAYRFHDVVRGRVLHDEPVGAAIDELLHVLLCGHEVDQDRFRVGRAVADTREQRKTVAVRERGIEQHDLRFRIAQQLCGGAGGVGAADDVDVRVGGEQSAQAVAHETIVFDEHDADTVRRRGRGATRAPFTATTIQRSFAITRSIIQTAPALGRHPAFNAANGPWHTPPPFLDVMYFSRRANGIHQEDEASHDGSPL